MNHLVNHSEVLKYVTEIGLPPMKSTGCSTDLGKYSRDWRTMGTICRRFRVYRSFILEEIKVCGSNVVMVHGRVPH